MKILFPYFRRYWLTVLAAGLSVAAATLTALWIPRLLQSVLNALTANHQHQLIQYGVQLTTVGILGVIFGILAVFFAAKVTQGVTNDLRADLYAQIQSFSYANINQFSAGSLVVRLVNDMNQVMNLVMNGITQIVRVPFLFAGSLVLGVLTIPRLWWIFPLAMVLMILLAWLVFSQMGKLFTSYQEKIDVINNKAKEALQGIRVIKSFNQEEAESHRFEERSADLNQLNLRIGNLFVTSYPVFMVVAYAAVALALLLVGKDILAHPQEVTAISTFITYLMQMIFAIMIAGMLLTMMSRGLVALERISEVLATKPALTFSSAAPAEALDGSVEFEHVSFAYPDQADRLVLKDITFKIQPGEMIGIVGATGAGKTTLAQLIPRLFDPTEGTVKVGGRDLREVNEQSLRRTVSFVLQRATLFSGTIKDNLRQGKADATLREMQLAARLARADEFITQFNDEYNHQIEERSANLSGGQKQRLSLARGLIAQPKILILDDTTSALDAESEKIVQEALEHELGATTTIIIAEKIMSVVNADRIFVLDNGQIQAQGTHTELLQTSPLYKEIYDTQVAHAQNFH